MKVMDFLKALFEQGALTWEQFSEAVSTKGYKLADLSTGNYVAKKKYEDEVGGLNTTITDLKEQITTRDTDITGLKKQIEDAGNDATKIAELNNTITKMQGDYEQAKSDYESKLASQSYEFAAKEFSSTKKFTSSAAKREFERELISANLKMKDKSIMGADDFLTKWQESNPDALVVETLDPTPAEPIPTFVQPTPPAPTPDANPFDFNFMGVRAH